MGVVDALLGRIYSKGVEVELRGGLNAGAGLKITPDDAAGYNTLALDDTVQAAYDLGGGTSAGNTLYWDGAAWAVRLTRVASGDNTAVAAGSGEVALNLSGAAQYIVPLIASEGDAIELQACIQHRADAGGVTWTDVFTFTLSYDGTFEWLACQDGQSASAPDSIVVTGASTVEYRAELGGTFALAMVQDATARHAQVECWIRPKRNVQS